MRFTIILLLLVGCGSHLQPQGSVQNVRAVRKIDKEIVQLFGGVHKEKVAKWLSYNLREMPEDNLAELLDNLYGLSKEEMAKWLDNFGVFTKYEYNSGREHLLKVLSAEELVKYPSSMPVNQIAILFDKFYNWYDWEIAGLFRGLSKKGIRAKSLDKLRGFPKERLAVFLPHLHLSENQIEKLFRILSEEQVTKFFSDFYPDREFEEALRDVRRDQINKYFSSLSKEELGNHIHYVDIPWLLDHMTKDQLISFFSSLSKENMIRALSVKSRDEITKWLIDFRGLSKEQMAKVFTKNKDKDTWDLQYMLKNLRGLPGEQIDKLFRGLSEEQMAKLFRGLSEGQMVKLFRGLSEEQMSKYLNSLSKEQMAKLLYAASYRNFKELYLTPQ